MLLNFAFLLRDVLTAYPSNCLLLESGFEPSVFQQVARKLAMVEADLERAEERAEAGEA